MAKKNIQTQLDEARMMLKAYPEERQVFVREILRLEAELAEKRVHRGKKKQEPKFFTSIKMKEGKRLGFGASASKADRLASETVGRLDKADKIERTHVAELKIREFLHFFEATEEGKPDSDIIRYLYALFLRVYVLAQRREFLSKTDACALIPLKHPVSCYKYLNAAVDREYLKFNRDQVDKRKYMLVGTEKLVAFVEGEIDASLASETTLHSGQKPAIGLPAGSRH